MKKYELWLNFELSADILYLTFIVEAWDVYKDHYWWK